MRGKAMLVGLVLAAAGVTGCKQQCFLSGPDYKECHSGNLLPRSLELDPGTSNITPSNYNVPAPMTVNDLDRPIKHLSLREAIALALEQGNIGTTSQLGFLGSGLLYNDQSVQFGGRGISLVDNMRVLALDPAITATDIESALSKFDARWLSGMQWQKQDNAVANILQNFQNGATARFNTGIVKPLPTGGVAGITISHDYNFLSNPPAGVVNPFHRPRVQVTFEQPLLRDFGVEINQLNTRHPGSTLNPGFAPSGGRTEGILLTRIRFDQQRVEFERQVQFLVLNVESAYWNLYRLYWALYSREQALRQAYETWRINKINLDVGRMSIKEEAQARGQYHLFRGQRLEALGEVLEQERQLRGLLGMPVEDGTRLVPSDSPTLAPFNPDWTTALNDSLALRPDLILARQELKARQLDLILQKNQLRPDLRLGMSYDVNGLGTRLDGSGSLPGTTQTENALHSLALNQFNNWQIGLTLDVPIGYRDANSAVRAARLRLAQSYYVLQEGELRAQRYLARVYRGIFQNYEQIRIQQAQREAFAQQLDARFKEFLAGRGTLDILLEAQRFWADALANEYRAITDYQISLVSFQFARGLVLQYNNIMIAEGPLPACAQMRAVDHEQARMKGLTLCERPIVHGTCCTEPGKECLGLPNLPTAQAVSLPELLAEKHTVPELPGGLPPLLSRPKTPVIPVKNETGTPTGPMSRPGSAPAALPTPWLNPSATPETKPEKR